MDPVKTKKKKKKNRHQNIVFTEIPETPVYMLE